MSIIRTDSHCHLFNGEYAFREALAILWDVIRNRYPHEVARALGLQAITPLSASDRWKAKLQYIATLFSVATGSCKDNYYMELKGYTDSSLGEDKSRLALMPLMMDIFYMFADSIAVDWIAQEEVTPTHEEVEQLKIQACVLMQAVLIEARNTVAIRTLTTDEERKQAISELQARMEKIIKRYSDFLHSLSQGLIHRTTTAPRFDFAGAKISWGYYVHFRELYNLQAENSGYVFPFLAVDPRRPGITNLVTKGKVTSTGKKLISKEGPFYGIKLYPPLGYFPNDPRLHDIYAHCINNDFPVIAHCQPVSFVNPWSPTPSPGEHFAHPRNWKAVLNEFNKLRLNLAHFGGIDDVEAFANSSTGENGEWTKTIIELLDYENVYTDISAFADPGADKWLQTILKRYPVVEKKLLFGTDFIINMTHANLHGQLKNYFNYFPALPLDSFTRNPWRFLGLP